MDSRAAGRGCLFLGFGAFALFEASAYELGTPTSMGPGFFPALVAALLVAMGLTNIAVALRAGAAVALPRFAPVPAVFITAGVVAFGLLIERTGLLLALAALVGLAFAARRPFRPLDALASYAVLAAIGSLLYVYGLGLPASYLLWR